MPVIKYNWNFFAESNPIIVLVTTWGSFCQLNLWNCFFLNYRKVASRSTSRLVARPRIFWLLMKGKFDPCVLWPLAWDLWPLNSRPVYCSRLYGSFEHQYLGVSFGDFKEWNLFPSITSRCEGLEFALKICLGTCSVCEPLLAADWTYNIN